MWDSSVETAPAEPVGSPCWSTSPAGTGTRRTLFQRTAESLWGSLGATPPSGNEAAEHHRGPAQVRQRAQPGWSGANPALPFLGSDLVQAVPSVSSRRVPKDKHGQDQVPVPIHPCFVRLMAFIVTVSLSSPTPCQIQGPLSSSFSPTVSGPGFGGHERAEPLSVPHLPMGSWPRAHWLLCGGRETQEG